MPLYGVLVDHSNLRQLLLHRGPSLTTMPHENRLEELVPRALKKLRDDGVVSSGDKIIIVARQPEPEADESFLLKLSILSCHLAVRPAALPGKKFRQVAAHKATMRFQDLISSLVAG